MQKKFPFLACFFICVECLSQQYPFVQYTPKDGLVNSRVRKVYQDSKGRLYFVTYGGLSVYDGTRFMNYTRQEGLPNDLINDVLEINPDTILIATNTGGINTLVHGKIGNYPLAGDQPPLVNSFLKSNDGHIYTAGDNGLYVLTGNKFTHFPVKDKNGKDLGIYLDKIMEWNNYLLMLPWNDRIERLILYDKISRQTKDVYPSSAVINMQKDRDGNVWITGINGIRLLDIDSLKKGMIRLKEAPSKFSSVSKQATYLIFFDRATNTWTYNGKDIRIIPSHGNEQVISSEYGLKTTSLINFYEDREGIIWIATDGNGVLKLRGSNVQLLNSLPTGHLLAASAVQQTEDTVWLYNNADNSVLRVYNNEIKKFHSPVKDKFGGMYQHGRKLYIVSQREMLCVNNKNEQSSYDHPVAAVIKLEKEARFGHGMIDPYGNIIQLIAKGDSTFSVCVYDDNKLLSEYKISSLSDKMIFDKEQRLWVPTRDDHLMVFTLHPDQPGHYLQLLEDYKEELPAPGIRAITKDISGNVWIGTRYNGVYKIELSGEKVVSVKQFTTHDGLTDNFVYSIACDNNNNIWAGTQSGLDKIFLKNGHYIISNVSKSNNFFQTILQIAITKNNTVWALTSEGSVLKTEPPSFSSDTLPPPLLLTLLEVNSNPFNDSVKSFSYRQNNFTFNVAAPSFVDEKSILYSYQLQGSGNDNWSTASNNPYLNFSNLSSGAYTLNVKAQFPEAMYPPQTASYSFTILPPWWRTVLFRLIAATLIMGLLIVATRFYYRRKLRRQKIVLEKQQAIEKERTRIATDMHDDLGAGLSRIKFLSETIGIKKQQQLPIEEDISKIRQYSHEMIDKMGEIVWALNEKNDTLSDLLSYTRSYAVEYLSQNGIECTVEAPDVFPSDFVTGEFRRNVFLTVKEALHNVIKHSQASVVSIKISTQARLNIEIKDNGIGFDSKNTRPFSNGIMNMEKRITEIGGKFEMMSSAGTMIKINVPL